MKSLKSGSEVKKSFFFVATIKSDSSSDEGSIPEERISTPDREYNYPRDHLSNSREQMKLPSSREHSGRHPSNMSDRTRQNLPPPPVINIFWCCHIFIGIHLYLCLFCSPCQIHQVPVHHQPYIEFKKIATI